MIVEKIKETYPKGTLIVLREMRGESQMPCGLKGTVEFVDDVGQIHMRWENGSSLALNVEKDAFKVICKGISESADEVTQNKDGSFVINGVVITSKQAEQIADLVQKRYTLDDVQYCAEEYGISLNDGEIDAVATMFAVDKDYDCRLCYWDNLLNLIRKVKGAL